LDRQSQRKSNLVMRNDYQLRDLAHKNQEQATERPIGLKALQIVSLLTQVEKE
jgi:hypothetical protein